MRYCENRIKAVAVCLLLSEAVLAMILGIQLLAPKQTWQFTQKNVLTDAGGFLADGTYRVLPEDGADTGVCLSTEPLALPKGVYRAEIRFDAQKEQALKITAPSVGYHGLLCNVVSLRENTRTNHTGVTALLLQDAPDVSIQILYNGEGSLTISSLTLTHTNQEYSMLLWILLAISVPADGCLWMKLQSGREKPDREQKQIIFLLTVMAVLSCMPLYVDYFQLTDDVLFHITRIEGLVQAWSSGQFPARMQPYWLENMGYPVSIMYGDVFLWPQALLHLSGFDLMQSYKAGVAMMNLATILISYFCFRDLFGSRKTGLLGTFLYTFSLYRLYNIYMRGAVGEYTAMMFLPMIACALHGLLQQDIQKAKNRKYIFLLAAGYGGLLVSHVLSFEFAAFFTVATLVIFWKRTLRKITWISILQAALLAITANLWFLVPFLDYAMHMKLRVLNNEALIQARGIYPAQLLSLFQWAGEWPDMTKNGMQNARPYGMGIAMMLAAGSFLYVWSKRGRNTGTAVWKTGKTVCCFGIAASFFSLYCFPWDALSKSSLVLRKLISSIQFPYRFLELVVFFFSMTACALFAVFLSEKKQLAAGFFAAVMIAVTLSQSFFLLDDVNQMKEHSELRNAEALGSSILSGAEYLLVDTKVEDLHFQRVDCSEKVYCTAYQKNGLTVRFTCENQADQEGYLEPTLQYYLGYEAVDDATGQKMQLADGSNHTLRVLLPAGYKGGVTVRFTGMWYWRAADLLSLTIWIGILLFFVTKQLQKRRTKTIGKTIENE